MKRIAFLSLLITILFLSCGEKMPKLYAIEIICDQPLSTTGKFPDYFSKLLTPDEYDEDFFLLPKPIKINRVDINNASVSIEAFAFENIADPTFNLYNTWLPVYFRDSVPPQELLAPRGNKGSTIDWIKNNTDKTIVIISGNEKTSDTNNKNVNYCEDELTAKAKIVELLKAKPNSKIYLVNCPGCGDKGDASNHDEKEVWISAGDKESENSDYHIILVNAEPYIQDDKDHDYGHPEAYSMLIKSCRVAISKNQGPDLASHLREDCERKEIICRKLKPGHEGRWRLILMALNENNSSLLEQVYVEVKKTRQELINDLLQNKGHDDHHEKH
ncbi:MAG: hypothetical protein IPM92_02830 [Saprospiraceae bacterium]|nr:hypothetical protein [Saprospiraceae bacterium]